MLAGTLECREGRKPIINISDMAGKSGLMLGLSRMMNIYPYVRVRSRNLKLWGVDTVTPRAYWSFIENRKKDYC